MNDILDFAKRILGFGQEQPASPEAELLLKQVEAERAGTPMPGSVAYERQQQTLPTPSQYDVIQPSPPQGPRDYTDYAAAWLADKIQDPNLSPSDRAAATRRLQEAFALPADLLGLQSAYNAGQQGALGNYGTAALEGAMAGLPVVAEGAPLVREAMTAIRARPAAQDVVDLARRQLLMPSTVSAEGPVVGSTTALDRLLETPVDRRQVNQAIAAAPVVAKLGPEVVTEAVPAVSRATPEVVSSHLDSILSQSLTADDPILNKYLSPNAVDELMVHEPIINPKEGSQVWNAFTVHGEPGFIDHPITNNLSSSDLASLNSEYKIAVRNKLENSIGHSLTDEEFNSALDSILDKKTRLSELGDFNKRLSDAVDIHDEDFDSFYDYASQTIKSLAKESSTDKVPSAQRLFDMVRDKYTPEYILKNFYGFTDEEIPKILDMPTSGNFTSVRAALEDHVNYANEALTNFEEDKYWRDDFVKSWKEGLKERNVTPQVESAPRTSEQVLGLQEEPKSISESRAEIQSRIKDLRTQLNAFQKGTSEHEALQAQIAEEGAKLKQLRGPAQEAVVKEAPPVEIKSRSPTGLYSEAEEIARRLPQADTPENLIKAILNKGVKDAELIDARVMNKDRTPTPEFTEYLASRGSQQPISDAVGDYVATNLPTLQKRVLKGYEAAYIDSPTLKEHPDGGSDYRELLFHYPGSGYDGGHWRTIQPHTAMHARVENKPDSLFVHEMQADQAQQGRQMGFRDPSAAAALERVRDEFNAVKDRLKVAENEYYKIDNALKTSLMQGIADSSVKSVPKEVQDAFSARAYKRPEGEFDEVMKTIPSGQDANSVLYQRLLDAKNHYTDLFADYQRLSNEFTDALNNVAASSPIPLSPHMEDTGAWTRAMAKELLVEAVDSGKGKIEISGGSVQNFRANAPETLPEDYIDHSHYYNTIVPSEFKAVLKELDPSADMDKVVRVRKVKPTDTEVENDPAYQQLREMTRDMAEQIQKYPDQGEIDALKTFHGDDWAEQAEITKDEMREELAGHQETLMQFFDRRDRVEINLTPKMIEAIKGKKLKKYFQGGRVE